MEHVPSRQSVFRRDRTSSWETEHFPDGQNIFRTDRTLSGRTEHFPDGQNTFPMDRTLSRWTEHFPDGQNTFQEGRTFSGQTEQFPEKQNIPSKKGGNPGFPGLPPNGLSALRADERLIVHPIGVTAQPTERTNLEVIDSNHGQAAERCLLRTGNRYNRPGTEYATNAFECVAHVKGDGALLTFGFHNDLTALGPVIDRPELRLAHSRHRRLC